MKDHNRNKLTCFHWGTYSPEVSDGKLIAMKPFSEDVDPSPIASGYVGVLDDELRIRQPMVRKSWLEQGPGPASERPNERRGLEEFVAVSWEQAEQLVADELQRVIRQFGNESIFASREEFTEQLKAP